MQRLVLATFIASIGCLPTVAAAQQPVPMRAVCVPSEPVLADVQSGAATMRKVFADAEGDDWFVITRVSDGAAVIGWISVERGLFCIVAGGPPKKQEGNPGRGA